MRIANQQIDNLTAIYHMALGLEHWFPKNNSPFAYGTRLCEETGELLEALLLKPTSENRQHLVKEIEDMLQIVVGVLGIYGLVDKFPRRLEDFFKDDIDRISKDDYIQIAIYAGRFADAVNHIENQGVKAQKHGGQSHGRLLQKAHELVESIGHIIQGYKLLGELESQIAKDYQYLIQKGHIHLVGGVPYLP